MRATGTSREQHTRVHDLLHDGVGLRAIARQLGLARNTVRRLAHAAHPDELLVRQWTGCSSTLDPYQPYLNQRWSEGCTVARHLFHEVRERGFPGSEKVVKKYVRELRVAFPHPEPLRKRASVRDVTSWITCHPDSLTGDQAQQLKAILAHRPELQRTTEHVRSFAELMNSRRGKQLHTWIARVQGDDLPALHTFTTGLGQDLDAVVAGLSSLQLRRGGGPQQQDQDVEAADVRPRQLRSATQAPPPRSRRSFMIAVLVTLRGLCTESDPEPLLRYRRHGPPMR